MPYVSCAAKVAANIMPDCANPNVNGYSGRGVYINRADIASMARDAQNPRKITAITLVENAKTIAMENLLANPYTGTNVALNAETGKYDKSVSVRVQKTGAEVSRDVIEPLAKSPLGGVLILEKLSGQYIVVGAERGVKASEQTQNEYENEGEWTNTLATSETYAEVEFFDTDKSTTREAFEELLTSSY